MSKFVIIKVTDEQAEVYQGEETRHTNSVKDTLDFIANPKSYDACIYENIGLCEGVSLFERNMLLDRGV